MKSLNFKHVRSSLFGENIVLIGDKNKEIFLINPYKGIYTLLGKNDQKKLRSNTNRIHKNAIELLSVDYCNNNLKNWTLSDVNFTKDTLLEHVKEYKRV